MTNWDVTVSTDSGFYKKVRLEGYVTQKDAESAALGMTGGRKVVSIFPSNQEPKTRDYFGQEQQTAETVEVHHYYQEPEEDDEDFYEQLDDAEMEMYDLMCKIAMEEGEELPTISEFYEWLES